MKCDQDLCLNLWYDFKKLLWQDELNPRVRCAFGNVFYIVWKRGWRRRRSQLREKQCLLLHIKVTRAPVTIILIFDSKNLPLSLFAPVVIAKTKADNSSILWSEAITIRDQEKWPGRAWIQHVQVRNLCCLMIYAYLSKLIFLPVANLVTSFIWTNQLIYQINGE